MKVVIVIPAYNEASMIAEVILELRSSYPHIFVVDDGSKDNTAEVAKSAGAYVLRHVLNRGQGAALKTGIDAAVSAGADIVVTFDADGQMSVQDIASLIAPVVSGSHDVVLGSRFLGSEAEQVDSKMPLLRRLTLKMALLFTKLTTGLALTDTHNGLRAFSKKSAKELTLYCDRMAHASEILEEIARKKWKHCEVPVRIKYTEYSMQKGQKFSGAFKIIRDLIISSWVR